MAEKKTIALCLEYPLALRGGVSVLVETLLQGFHDKFRLVLVSPDMPESLSASPVGPLISKHLRWNGSAISRASARQLAEELAGAGVSLAHFHFGGNYGWGNRHPAQCPIPSLDRLGVPCCSTIHLVVSPLDGYCGPQKPLLFKLALFPAAWLGKMRVLRHLRREVAVSQHDAVKLRRWYSPLRGRIVQVYHSRLETAKQRPSDSARESLILNVGHVAWRKGQLVLCEAFAKIAARFPDWKLLLAGDLMEQPIVDKIRAVAKAGGLEQRITLAGPRSDAMDLMHRAAIYVQPSYYEALGLALQEALFAGCACIGTRAGGIPELVRHEHTGLLVERGQTAEMASALETLMSDAALRAKYGRRGADSIVERGMTAEQMISNHLRLYESILAGS
jgi:glycosyltransferase involved in cell wall biosynthesis